MVAARLVLVGRFGAPHGVRGEVRLKSFTAEAEQIARYSTLRLASDTPVRILSARAQGGMLVARVAGVTTREAAQALANADLFIDRAELPRPDEDEFYHSDLIGLEARDKAGHPIGTVVAVHDFGAGDIVAIGRPDGRELLVAFTRANVPVVDIAGGFVVVAPPAETEARAPETGT
ncbi:MAG: ribosome maturation factor RimM [Alphaproteobacteria bacterium]|nr:MAG: ribosome maturation factor RimM [Alphaproteobacteria bacterium]